MTSKDHAKTLGIMFFIYVGFQILVTALTGVMMLVMMGAMSQEMGKMPHRANEPDPALFMGMFGGIMIVTIVAVLIFLIPAVLAAFGLRRERPWARTWLIVASVIALLNLPIGTALGIYGLWFAVGDAGKQYFGGETTAATMPPPPPMGWQ